MMMPLQHAAATSAALPGRSAMATKLRIGPVDDPLEREADRVADAVVAGRPAGTIGEGAPTVARRQCAECAAEDDKTLRRHEGPGSHTPSYAPATATAALAHGGQSLSAEQRAYFEPRFGQEFSHVRLHTDDHAARAAQDVNALAFTVGHDIAFAAGRFAPDTDTGRRLIAHELAHVVQGAHGTLQRQPTPLPSRRRSLLPKDPAPPTGSNWPIRSPMSKRMRRSMNCCRRWSEDLPRLTIWMKSLPGVWWNGRLAASAS